MDVATAPVDMRNGDAGYRRRSPSPIRRRRSPSPARRRSPRRNQSRSPIYRSRSRSQSRDRYYRDRDGDRSPRRHRRYNSRSRSRSPPRGGYYGRRRSPLPPPRHFRRSRGEVIRGSEEERQKSCSIFVGNIPYSFEERDVVNMFERFGRLKTVSVPIDRYTRRNRGFTFVEFEQRADAEDAFNKYSGYEIEGRKLRLDWDIGRTAKDTIKETTRVSSPRRDYRNGSPMRSPARDNSPPPPPRGRSHSRSPPPPPSRYD